MNFGIDQSTSKIQTSSMNSSLINFALNSTRYLRINQTFTTYTICTIWIIFKIHTKHGIRCKAREGNNIIFFTSIPFLFTVKTFWMKWKERSVYKKVETNNTWKSCKHNHVIDEMDLHKKHVVACIEYPSYTWDCPKVSIVI